MSAVLEMDTKVKKGYKLTELGEIPEEWAITKIEDIARIKTGGKNTQDKVSGGKYPFYVRSQTIERINSYSYNEEAVLTAGDGVGTGKVFHYVTGKFELHQRVYKISDFKSDFDGYFFYLFFSTNFHDRIMQMTAKSSVDSVRMEMISKMLIPMPPLPEQQAIAKVLSNTDALLQSLEQQLEKKRLIKQGAMQELLRPKAGWEVKKLGEIGLFKNGINKASEDFGFGYPFVNLMDVFSKKSIDEKHKLALINSNEAEREMYDLKAGDVLFIRSSVKPSGVGLTSVIEENLNNTVFSGFIIRFRDSNYLSKEFKKHCFQASDFRKKIIESSTVSANTNINQEALKKVSISFPGSKVEQNSIANVLSNIDNSMTAIESKIAKYKAIKSGLMQQLLTGKIRLV